MVVKGGTKGKSFNDRQLAGEVRGAALEHLNVILKSIGKELKKDEPTLTKFQADIMLKLTPTLLPRLNEVSGTDGEPLVIKFDSAFDE